VSILENYDVKIKVFAYDAKLRRLSTM